jgi:integrase
MGKAGRAARSICYALDVVRQVYNFANKNSLIDIPSPTKGFKKPKKDNKRFRFLSLDEANTFLPALKSRSQSLFEISLISLHCGLRAGEIFALTWGDIDLNNDQLIAKDTKGGLNRFPKMTSAIKDIFLNKSFGNKNQLVFPDRNGKERKAISRAFSRTVADLGLNDGVVDPRDKVVFHTLRHTYASWLVQSGVPIYEVSKLLGHSTITMTERYAHLAPSNFENSVKVIENMISANERFRTRLKLYE